MQKNHIRNGLFLIVEVRARFVILKTAGLSAFMCASLTIVSGCAFTNDRIDVSYQPIAKKRSPLASIPPRKLALHLEDERPEDLRDRVGDKRNNLGMVTARVVSNEPVTHVLYNALERELNQNGHQVVDAATGDCDSVVRIRVSKFWAEHRIRFWDLEMIGTISANVEVLHAQTGSPFLSQQINATARESHQLAVGSVYESVLNEALKEFVHNFAFDSRILTALRRAGKDDPDHP